MEETTNIQVRLNNLTTEKLIDIMKNFKQYGYDQNIRNHTINILKERGIDEEYLKMTGNFENHNYNTATRLFLAFKTNSKIAFTSYLILVLWSVVGRRIDTDSELLGIILAAAAFGILIIFFVSLLKSFLNQSDFYKLTGEDYAYGALIYFFIGMPFYIIMYFIFTSQMTEKMKTIT